MTDSCAVQKQEDQNFDISVDQEEKAPDGPIMRFIKQHPLAKAVFVVIPTIFFCYKWRKALGMNRQLEDSNSACVLGQQELEEELAMVRSKLEEREEFIKTTFEEVNGKFGGVLSLIKHSKTNE